MDIKKDISEIIKENPAYAAVVSRVSVRQFENKAVPDQLVAALLHAAMSAPSGVNRQPWELVVIDDRTILEKLAAGLPYAASAAKAPLAIILCGNNSRFLDGDDSTLWVQDLAAASENILIAANALGLGGVYTCIYPHPDRMETVSEILGLPEDIIPFNLIPIGYPVRHKDAMDKWRPERVHINGYSS